MNIVFLFFFILPTLIFAAQPKFSATERERHQEMIEYFGKQQEKVPWIDDRYLTGRWGSARDFLADRGVSISSQYVINAAANPVGGAQQAITQASSWGSDINYDLGKRTPLKGWHLYLSWAWRWGQSLSNRKIQNQFNVQQVFGAETLKVIGLYIQYAPDSWLRCKLGRLSSGDNFNVSPLYYYFMNNGFDGNPIVPNFNIPFTAYTAATWGAYLYFKPVKKMHVKLAVYNNNNNIKKNKYHGLYFSFKHPQGALLFSEVAYLYDQDSPGEGLPGNYIIGAAYSTNRKPHFIGGKKGRGNYELYIQWDQMVYRTTAKSGVTPFFTFLYFPDNRNLFPYFFMGGVVAEGIIPSRPEDSINFGVNWGQYSSDLRKTQKEAGLLQQHSETDFELNYKCQLTKFFFIQPNLQYIIWPKGIKSVENAFVIGVQSAVMF